MPERNDNEHDEIDTAVLADGGSIHTTSIGIIGGTAQVDVALPSADDDDFDDDVVDDGYIDDDASTGDIPVGVDLPERESPTDDGSESEDLTVIEATVDAEPTPDSETATADAADTGDVEGSEVPDPELAQRESSPAAAVATGPVRTDSGRIRTASPSTPATGPVIGTVVATVGGTASTGAVPTTRRAAHHLAEGERHANERVQVARQPEPVLQSRRLGDLEPGRESPDLLTAERLLDPSQVARAEPEGGWQRFVYAITGHRLNLGDGKRARSRKELDRRISAPLTGGAKFVPVLSRKGGVGKTTVTTLLGMALADARDDRVIAIDANPDRGTLAERIGRTSGKTVRDLVRVRAEVLGFNDLSSIVARDETRLDVLASDSDPNVSEAFSDRDYSDVATIAAHYYSIVLTDTGTGIVHSVMGATLGLSDQLVVVAGLSVDEARLASETLTWLESNGFAEQVKGAIVVLNTARPGTPLVRASELETHFRSRVRAVVRLPYDPHLATGSAVTFRELSPATREAARELAANVVEGLRLSAQTA